MGKRSRARLLVSISAKDLGGFVISLKLQSLGRENGGNARARRAPKRGEPGRGCKNIRKARSELAQFVSDLAQPISHCRRSTAIGRSRRRLVRMIMSGRVFIAGGSGSAPGCLRRSTASSRMRSTTWSGICSARTTIGSSSAASTDSRRENHADSSPRKSVSATVASTTARAGIESCRTP